MLEKIKKAVVWGVCCLAILFSLPFTASAQDKKKEKPTLAINFRPILPSGLFDNRSLETRLNDTSFILSPRPSYSFGVMLRQRINKTFTFETGLHYVQRVYRTDFMVENSLKDEWRSRIVNYEVPMLALIYIQIARNAYLNNAFGLSLDFYPSDVVVIKNNYVQFTQRKYWVLPALMANVGAELRTEKKGNFYIGASYHRMLSPMAYVGFYPVGYFPEATTVLTGHYFALDFKYFLPTQRTDPIQY